ncbi:murein hydrolase activator EnvC family protein [Brevibacillus dissolubilis]|uniref:murein hydrolase activator EnvC family protein n=1 Tax=Brevibacillus dissolubilis TaxID=1844116 RepID=UPI001115C528|nr:M23 family metallopeptidase [Brevibacillus dissolubilis]
MRNKVTLAVVMASMLAWGVIPAPAGYASKTSLSKINKEIAEIRAQKKAQQNNVKAIESQIATIKKERGVLEQELVVIDTKRNDIQRKIDKLDQDIEATTKKAIEAQEKLDESIERVAQREILLKTRIKTMYKRGNVSYLEVLLGSSDFGDFLTRMQGLRMIVENDTRILEDNIQDKQAVEKHQQEVEGLLANYKQMFAESEDLKAELDHQFEKSKVIKAELEKQEEHLHEIEEEEEQRLIELVQMEASKVAERKRLESVSKYKGGRLGLPIASGSFRFTSGFGMRSDPFTGRSAGHNGLDMAAPRGTTIYAAEDGIVVFASYMRGFGNTVVIQHNQEIRTLYGHIREGGIKVSVGQAVKRGQKIAEVGSTGRSTGNHLHFTVYKNNRAVDPAPYIR